MNTLTDFPPPISTSLSASIVPGYEPAVVAPAMFGFTLQFGLFCILVTQAVMYFARQGHGLEDSRLFRLYIAVVLAATTLHVGIGVWRLYTMCVVLTPWFLQKCSWCEPASSSVVISAVHVFFVHRCYKLSRSKFILGILSIMLLAQSISWIIMIANSFSPAHIDQMRSATLAVFSIAVILDSLTSATLSYNLWRQRTGHGPVDAVVLRVLRMTVESIVPCLIFTIMLLIGTAHIGTLPLGALFIFALPSLVPLYANALLTTLNARAQFRRRLEGAQQRSGGRISLRVNQSGSKSNRTLHVSAIRGSSHDSTHDENGVRREIGSELVTTRSVTWDAQSQPTQPLEDVELEEMNRPTETRRTTLRDSV